MDYKKGEFQFNYLSTLGFTEDFFVILSYQATQNKNNNDKTC